jgi:GNAT superfamily N-acetyltransferase
MVEYHTFLPPFDAPFLAALHGLGGEVLGQLDRDEMEWRLTRLPDASVQVAKEGQLLELGYATGRRRYHRWLGGVRAEARRQGIALRLMNLQHDWLRAHGYGSVESSTVPDNAAMLSLNLRVGFRVIGTYNRGDGTRVMMAKTWRERCQPPISSPSRLLAQCTTIAGTILLEARATAPSTAPSTSTAISDGSRPMSRPCMATQAGTCMRANRTATTT